MIFEVSKDPTDGKYHVLTIVCGVAGHTHILDRDEFESWKVKVSWADNADVPVVGTRYLFRCGECRGRACPLGVAQVEAEESRLIRKEEF